MFIPPPFFRTVTQFTSQRRKIKRRLTNTGAPVVLLNRGRPELVVQDVEAYRKLIARLDHLEAMDAIREGMADIHAGRGIPLKQALAQMKKAIGKKG